MFPILPYRLTSRKQILCFFDDLVFASMMYQYKPDNSLAFCFASPNRSRLQAAVLGVAKPFKLLLKQVKADLCFFCFLVCVGVLS